ncbi:galactose-specific lectin nattectin-like, partial [Haliotis rufescens]|uniref:galactose-specific lectin nattectin-like n=1 Tax=Haliotis rufescens TaxID=6454 RepID=UPI00201ECFBD
MLVFIFLLLLQIVHIEGDRCPDAWIRYGNSCYMFIGTPETWMEASQQCVSMGAALAAIETVEENAFITGYLKVFGDIGADMKTWIGGNDIEIEGIWKWSPSGERVTYTNWEPGQPDG